MSDGQPLTLVDAFDPSDLPGLDPYLTADEREELDALVAQVAEDVVEDPAALGLLPPDPHVAYQLRPVDWAVEMLGVPRYSIEWSTLPEYAGHAWDGTADPLAVMMQALANWSNVAVEAGTGTQKSYTAAVVMLWFLACWKDARVFTFAPKEDQLRLFMWMEVTRLWPRFQLLFPTATLSDLRIRMYGKDDSWAAHGYPCAVRAGETSATTAQGAHAAHMLIITEETPGIHPAVITAHQNTCTADHNLRLALGNPDNQLDTLHQLTTSPAFVPIRISALDAPNVVTGREIIPGAVSLKSIQEREAVYGVEDPMYKSRVRGLSPEQSVESVIRLEWLIRAAELYESLKPAEVQTWTPARGVDVAQSESGDAAAIARGRGPALVEVEERPCPNATILGRDVAAEVLVYEIDPLHVGVDPVGVGAATINELRELVSPLVQALWGSAAPYRGDQKGPNGETYEWVSDANEYYNLRAQMWWQFREDVARGRIPIKRDIQLFRELVTPKWKKKLGKVLVEEKEEIVKRLGGKSPNRADAAVYWNWVRPRVDVLGGRRAPRVNPNQQDPRAGMFGNLEQQAAAGTGTFSELPAEATAADYVPPAYIPDGPPGAPAVGVDELGAGF